MSILEAPQGGSPEVTLPEICRFTVGQYHRMVESGFLSDDDPVELLQGLLVRKMPKNPPHRLVTRRTRDLLERSLPSGWFVETQEPITTADSEPEPDVAVIRGSPEDYADRHPGPADVGLVVEVSDTTLQRDRTIKRRLYAAAGSPVYWVVNLNDGCVEASSEPVGVAEVADYSRTVSYGPSDEVPVILGGSVTAGILVGVLLP
jgi:Uma2 family endonuclease